MKLLFSTLILGICYSQPSALVLIEEQIESVVMVHCVEYEKDSKVGGQLTDINIVYTGNNTMDAKKDSNFYFVYGTYTYDKYTQVNYEMLGNANGKSFNKSGSTSYLAKIKEVLDEFRVQEIIIIKDQSSFDFQNFNYERMKIQSDELYPKVIRKTTTKKKDTKENKKKKKKD